MIRTNNSIRCYWLGYQWQLLNLYFLGAIFAVSAHAGNQLSAPLCEAELTIVPISEERVLSYPPEFQPHKQSLEAEDLLAFSERRFFINEPSLSLRVYQQDVSATTIVNSSSENRLLDDAVLLSAANGYLKQLGAGETRVLDSRSSVLLNARPLIAFSVTSTRDENFVLLLNYATGEMKGLVREAGSYALQRSLAVEHQRFIVSRVKVVAGQMAKHSIFDLETGRSVDIHAGLHTTIKISADGLTVLQSKEGWDHSGHQLYKNFLVNLPGRLDSSRPLNLEDEPNKIEFEGYIVGSSSDLTQFVVDKNNYQVNERYDDNSFPWISPNLSIVKVDGQSVRSKPLPGWQPILRKIKRLAKDGWTVPFTGIIGEMTPNGSHFAVTLKFRANLSLQLPGQPRRLFEFKRDWMGLWDLKKSRRPTEATSSDLDTFDDREPNPTLLALGKRKIDWPRQFASRLMANGDLILARSTAQQGLEGPMGSVSVKVARLKVDQPIRSLRELKIGPVNFDPHDFYHKNVGTTAIGVGPKGDRIIVEIRSVGTKVIQLLDR